MPEEAVIVPGPDTQLTGRGRLKLSTAEKIGAAEGPTSGPNCASAQDAQ